MECGFSEKRVLGQGAFGKVYEVDTPSGSKALKQVSGSIDITEIDVSRRTLHANLIHAYEVTQCAKGYGLLLDLADGSLRDAVNSGSYKLEDKLRNIWEALQGLAALHSAGIIHRDIKEDNILLKQGMAKLADFGLATYADSAMKGVVDGNAGTPIYMPPESLRKEGPFIVSTATDIWAMGITILQTIAEVCILCRAEADLRYYAEAWFSDTERYSSITTLLDKKVPDNLVAPLTILLDGMLKVNPAERHSIRQLLTSSNAKALWGTQVIIPMKLLEISGPPYSPELPKIRDEVLALIRSSQPMKGAVLFLALDLAYRANPLRRELDQTYAIICLDTASALISGQALPLSSTYIRFIRYLRGMLYPTNPYNIARNIFDVCVGLTLILDPGRYIHTGPDEWRNIMNNPEADGLDKNSLTAQELLDKTKTSPCYKV